MDYYGGLPDILSCGTYLPKRHSFAGGLGVALNHFDHGLSASPLMRSGQRNRGDLVGIECDDDIRQAGIVAEDRPSSTGSSAASAASSNNGDNAPPTTSVEQSSRLHTKPSLSFTAMIAMAILDAPNRRVVISDVYAFIMKRFPYFKGNERSWRNSVRHNLSQNGCFVKAGKSGEGVKTPYYWTIHPDYVEDFERGVFHGQARRTGPRQSVRRKSYSVRASLQPWSPYHLPKTNSRLRSGISENGGLFNVPNTNPDQPYPVGLLCAPTPRGSTLVTNPNLQPYVNYAMTPSPLNYNMAAVGDIHHALAMVGATHYPEILSHLPPSRLDAVAPGYQRTDDNKSQIYQPPRDQPSSCPSKVPTTSKPDAHFHPWSTSMVEIL